MRSEKLFSAPVITPGRMRHADILIVEDSRLDIKLMELAFRQVKVVNQVHVVMDGEAALQFLRNEKEYQKAPRPDLIVLDLNIALKAGREVLAEIKLDHGLKHIPVVIMTTSDAEEDILASYSLHANCYVKKPLELQDFLSVVQSVGDYWLTVAALLPQDR